MLNKSFFINVQNVIFRDNAEYLQRYIKRLLNILNYFIVDKQFWASFVIDYMPYEILCGTRKCQYTNLWCQSSSYMRILRDLPYEIVERHHSKWVESKTWLVGSVAAIRASLHVIHVYQVFNLKLKEWCSFWQHNIIA